MRVKIFLVLILCDLQQVHGSKSTKKKGGSRLKKIFKNSLIALAVNYGANEVVDAGKPQAADSNSLACKYNVPDQNAGAMMHFVKCGKDQDFEKYMFDNSQNCPKIKELYKQAESDKNCALNVPKNISDGALARFRGEQLSQRTNVEMLQGYLLSYPGKNGALFESEEFLSDFLRRWDVYPESDFEFFQFTSLLEMTMIAYPDDTMRAILMALRSKYKDVNADNAKRVLEVAKLAFPNDASTAVMMALRSKFKDVNVENAKKLFELTKLVYPSNARLAVSMALSESTDINADNVKKLLELTKLAYPDDTRSAVSMALDDEHKDVNADNAKKLFELTKLDYPDDKPKAVLMAMAWGDANVENAKRVLEFAKLAYPNNTDAAALMAMAWDNEYKDVNVKNVRRVLELTKLAYSDMEVAVSEALKSKYKDFNVDKVNKKYQELKNSWIWYLSSEQSIMKEALKVTYPEVVKEDF